MFRKLLRSKIHRATVTHADLEYEGSITISPELLEAAGILEYEAVSVWNITRGSRFETYTILGESGSETLCINGAAAHLVDPGDKVIIACFEYLEAGEVSTHKPKLIFLDEKNKIKHIGPEVAGPGLREAATA